jgi:shikimate kinase
VKENLMVICYDYGLSRRISKSLAEFLDMRLFDMLEMFLFDNAPYRLTDVINMSGEEYAAKKMRSVIKTELDLTGAVFAAEPKMLGLNQDLFDKLKENNFILFLKRDYKNDYIFRENMAFKSQADKDFFKLEIDELTENALNIENNLADIVVDIDGLVYDQIKEKVLKTLETYAG